MVLALSLTCSALGLAPAWGQTPEADAPRELRRVLEIRRGLDQVSAYADANPQGFARSDPSQPWLEEDRQTVRRAWIATLDYLAALEDAAREAARAARAARLRTDAGRVEFAAGYAGWVGTYRWASEWFGRCDRDPKLVHLLDEPAPELGLPERPYTRLKGQFELLRRRNAFAAAEKMYRELRLESSVELLLGSRIARAFEERLKEDAQPLRPASSSVKLEEFQLGWWKQGWSGVGRPAAQVPEVSTRILCGPSAPRDLEAELEPGDIVLLRLEPFWGDPGLAGWWNAAALDMGADGRLENRPECRTRFLIAADDGVGWIRLPELAKSGSLAVLRPHVLAAKKAEGLARVLPLKGRSYDFSGDLASAAAVTGAELVYRAYGVPGGGLRLPVSETLGRRRLSANDLARMFDDEFGLGAQQMDLVWFLDQDGAPSSVEEFRRSWRRPKWSWGRITQASEPAQPAAPAPLAAPAASVAHY